MSDWTGDNGREKCEICGGDTFEVVQTPVLNGESVEKKWHFFLERCTSCGIPRPIRPDHNYGRLGPATHLTLLPFNELPEPLRDYLKSLYPVTA